MHAAMTRRRYDSYAFALVVNLTSAAGAFDRWRMTDNYTFRIARTDTPYSGLSNAIFEVLLCHNNFFYDDCIGPLCVAAKEIVEYIADRLVSRMSRLQD